MIKFTKTPSLKVMSLIVIPSFLFTSLLYSCPVSEDSLRVPIQEKTFNRMVDVGTRMGGMEYGTRKFKVVLRFLESKVSKEDLVKWVNAQKDEMSVQDTGDLGGKIGLIADVLSLKNKDKSVFLKDFLDTVILCNVSKDGTISLLDGNTLRLKDAPRDLGTFPIYGQASDKGKQITGLIIPTDEGFKILLPKPGTGFIDDTEFMKALFHEILEFWLLSREGIRPDTAHEFAEKATITFSKGDRLDIRKIIIEAKAVDLTRGMAMKKLTGFINALKNNKYQKGAVVDLTKVPEDAEIIVVTDLHGRTDNLQDILTDRNNLEKIRDGTAILVIAGDAVHNAIDLKEMDSSIAIMNLIMDLKIEKPDNVHYLFADHDYLSNRARKRDSLSREEVYQGLLYEGKLREEFGSEYVKIYKGIAACSPLMMAADGLLALHGGPIKSAKNIKDVQDADVSNEDNDIVFEAMMGRWKDVDTNGRKTALYYDEKDMIKFKKKMGQKDAIVIVGHTPALIPSGTFYKELAPGHYVTTAQRDVCGYAAYKNGKIEFVKVLKGEGVLSSNASATGAFLRRPNSMATRTNL